MLKGIKIYNIKSFIRKDETGELTRNRISDIIRDVVSMTVCFPEKNILLDFRETTLPDDISIADVLKFALDASIYGDILINKIASLIPEDPKRMYIAKNMSASMKFKGIEYNYFTNFEQAMEWLSSDSP